MNFLNPENRTKALAAQEILNQFLKSCADPKGHAEPEYHHFHKKHFGDFFIALDVEKFEYLEIADFSTKVEKLLSGILHSLEAKVGRNLMPYNEAARNLGLVLGDERNLLFRSKQQLKM